MSSIFWRLDERSESTERERATVFLNRANNGRLHRPLSAIQVQIARSLSRFIFRRRVDKKNTSTEKYTTFSIYHLKMNTYIKSHSILDMIL